VFGYPLVLMDVTRRVMTAVSKADGHRAPVNQFAHMRAFPDHTFTAIVTPNVDTLYSSAWLDLSSEPIVLSVPEIRDRYYLMPFLDAWTNVFAVPGTRTTGNARADFIVRGPHRPGRLPEGMNPIESPTDMVWLIGRTETRGKDDYATVHGLQDRYRLTPLSALDQPSAPPAAEAIGSDVDVKTPPAEQVARMGAGTFFGRLNRLMKGNPPAAADAPAMARFATIGVVPDRLFDPQRMDPAVSARLAASVRAGHARILAGTRTTTGTTVNGWRVMPSHTGSFGTDYLWRAVVAMVGLGANLPADAMYPQARVDGEGQPLTGDHRYVVRFPKGQLPPVNAFWSLTVYDVRQALVRNPIDRYAIGDRSRLRFDGDGSLTLYLQHASPGGPHELNWLPTPAGSFNVVMRLYWPKPEIVEGTWKMPPVERVE
jgi:hypothetical protein